MGVGAFVLAAARLVLGCTGGGDGPSSADASTDGRAPSSTDPSTPPDLDAGAGPLPSYCSGIVFYASLDTVVMDFGSAKLAPHGTAVMTSSGLFGGGVSLRDDAGGDAGASMYLLGLAGPLAFPDETGTISVWYRGDGLSSTGTTPVLHRRLANGPGEGIVGAGLALVSLGGRLGLVNTLANGMNDTLLTFPMSEVRPFLRPNAFNHFSTSWRRGDAGGEPTATLVINGGTGAVFQDGGTDYADASISGGNLLVPYRGFTSRLWNNDAGGTSLRLGGTGQSVPQGDFDDLVVHDRVLSFEEVEAMVRANLPMREACRLR